MKIKLVILIAVCIGVLSCNPEKDPFLVSKNSIGLLNDSTQVKDLKMAFPNDSIAIYKKGGEFVGNTNDINIYDVTGEIALVLSPTISEDSTARIKTVRIASKDYYTKKGINSLSTFKDIRDNYEISNIQNSIKSVIVSTKEINAFFVIDKAELPGELRFDMNARIEALQIPEAAKIKNFFLQWN